jgi:hypothetical protein
MKTRYLVASGLYLVATIILVMSMPSSAIPLTGLVYQNNVYHDFSPVSYFSNNHVFSDIAVTVRAFPLSIPSTSPNYGCFYISVYIDSVSNPNNAGEFIQIGITFDNLLFWTAVGPLSLGCTTIESITNDSPHNLRLSLGNGGWYIYADNQVKGFVKIPYEANEIEATEETLAPTATAADFNAGYAIYTDAYLTAYGIQYPYLEAPTNSNGGNNGIFFTAPGDHTKINGYDFVSSTSFMIGCLNFDGENLNSTFNVQASVAKNLGMTSAVSTSIPTIPSFNVIPTPSRRVTYSIEKDRFNKMLESTHIGSKSWTILINDKQVKLITKTLC